MPLFPRRGGRARCLAALFALFAAFTAKPAHAVNFMVPRYATSVALMPNGKIIVAGGADATDTPMSSVEILDVTRGYQFVTPAQGALFVANPGGAMAVPRSSATITVLPNGNILVTGGWDGANARSDAEVYTPGVGVAAGVWTTVAGMSSGRYNHTATLLLTGKVLVCGGQTGAAAVVTATCDLFTPAGAGGAFAPTGSMLLGRELHSATILNDGTVWVAGGWNNDGAQNSNPPFIVTTERYSPLSGAWLQAQPLNVARAYHTATLSGDNKVVVSGGYNAHDVNFKLTVPTLPLPTVLQIPSKGVLNSSEFFDPTGGAIVPGPPMQARIQAHAAALLPSGLVSVYGGRGNIEPSNITSISPAPVFLQPSTVDGVFLNTTSTQTNQTITSGSGSVPLKFFLGSPVTGSIINGDIEFINPVVTLQGAKVTFNSNFDLGAGLRASLNGTPVGCDPTNPVNCGFVSGNFPLTNTNSGSYAFDMPVAAINTLPSQAITGTLFISTHPTSLSIFSGVTDIVAPSSFTASLNITLPAYLTGKTVRNLSLFLTPTQTATWTEKSSYTAVANGGNGFAPGPFTVNTVSGVNSINVPNFTFMNVTGTLFIVSSDLTYTIPQPDAVSFSIPLKNAGVPGSATLNSASFSSTFTASGIVLDNQTLNFTSADIIVRDMIFGDNQFLTPNLNSWAFEPPFFSVSRPGLTRVGASSLITPSGAEWDIGGRECTGGCAGLIASSFAGSRQDNVTLWSPTPTLTGSTNDPLVHAFHTATLLTDGTILLAGGTNGSSVLPNAEIFDPVAVKFTPTLSPLRVVRQQHTASMLPNGRVLLAGGFTTNAISTGPTNTAEIYYPDTKIFMPVPPMISSHSQHTAITLPNGNVFIAGGYKGATTVTGTAEIYSSTSVAWSAVPDMTTASGGFATGALEKRAIAAAVQLQDGRIMLCGGTNESGILSSVVAYDPAANSWAALSPMLFALQGHTATLLFDGRVLVAGGDDGFGETKTSMIFDPNAGPTGTWSLTGQLEFARIGHNATLLPNGEVMISGGVKSVNNGGASANALQSIEYFIPDANDWVGAGPDGTTTEDTPLFLMTAGPRAFNTVTLAPNGMLYFMGGANGSIGSGQSTSFYNTFESIYFTIAPDRSSINTPSLRQSTITTTTPSPFLPLASFNVTGQRFRGATEAAGGSGSANSSFSTPRLILSKVDGSNGGGSSTSPGFVVDLTNAIYANVLNQATLDTSLTVTLPNNNQLPYGWYTTWVAAVDIHTARAPFVQVGPPKPAGPAATMQPPTVLGISSVTYTWTGIPLPCDGYNLYSSTTGIFIATVAYAGTGVGGTAFTQTNLQPNTTTSILVAGYTLTGDGPLAASATVFTFATPPAALKITSVTFNSLNLLWDANGNTDGTVYEITQSTDWPSPFSQSVSTPVPFFFGTISTNVMIGQLLPNTTYSYRVQAFNNARVASDFSVFVTTQTRSPVAGVQGKALTSTSIQWSWNNAGSVNTYNVYNATSGAVIISTTATTFVDGGLAVDSKRVIAVSAVTGAGEGPLSPSATVFTLANVPVPAVPAITSLSTSSFTLGWSSADGNPLGTVYHVILYEYNDNGVKVTTIVPTGFTVDTIPLGLSLLAGVRYDSYITALNGDNLASAPLIVSTYTFAQRPTFVAPVFLGVTPVTISLQWNTVGNSTKTAYELTYSTDSTFATALSTAIPFSANYTGSTATVSGLLTAVTYYFRVRGETPSGQTTQYSFSTNTVTTNGGAPPGALAGTLYAQKNSSISGNLGDGRAVILTSPPGAFPSDTVATIAPFNVVVGSTLCPGGFNVAVTITDKPALQPSAPLYLTADFDPTSIGAVPMSQIALERFDPSGVCVPLDTIFYPNTLPRPTFRARINHFSQYQLVQIPLATSAGTARIFPNPYRASHDSYVTIDQVPPGSRVRIMTLRGEKILDQVANSIGLINWPGTNGAGRSVASGLYIVIVEANGTQKSLKLAVIR